jgi:hypothetical protein
LSPTRTLGLHAIKADARTLNNEAREQLKRALQSYPGSAKHVAIFAASRAVSWNDLQVALSREGFDNSSHIATIIRTVEDHIESEMTEYLDIGHRE